MLIIYSAPRLVLKPHPVFTPVLAVGNQLELLLEKRMVRMCYSETSNLNTAMRRSCNLMPMESRSDGWGAVGEICWSM
jgi:hypothetical protein